MSLDIFMVVQIVGLGFFVSLAVTGFARLGGLGDIPEARSNHVRTTPTSGGLGIIAGVGAAILVAAIFHQDRIFAQPGSAQKLASLLSLTFAISFLGLVDDRYVMRPRLKFIIMIALAFLATNALGSVTMLPFGSDHIYLLWWSGLVGTALWMFVVPNAVNFMDGINGIFGLSIGIASLALCGVALWVGAPVTVLITGSLAASLFGFLPYNLRNKAQVFAGDCGSLGAGFLYAGAVLFLLYEQPEMKLLYAGPILILPLLTDVFLTLIRKPVVGIGLMEPHNTHIYQRWARKLGTPMPATLAYGVAAVLMAVFVFNALNREALGSMTGFGLIVGVFVCLYIARSATLPD